MDRAPVFGTGNEGSIPSRGTMEAKLRFANGTVNGSSIASEARDREAFGAGAPSRFDIPSKGITLPYYCSSVKI